MMLQETAAEIPIGTFVFLVLRQYLEAKLNQKMHSSTPSPNLETNAKIYESVHKTECEAHVQCYIFHNFTYNFTVLECTILHF
jgi:hypothetical protein